MKQRKANVYYNKLLAIRSIKCVAETKIILTFSTDCDHNSDRYETRC